METDRDAQYIRMARFRPVIFLTHQVEVENSLANGDLHTDGKSVPVHRIEPGVVVEFRRCLWKQRHIPHLHLPFYPEPRSIAGRVVGIERSQVTTVVHR